VSSQLGYYEFMGFDSAELRRRYAGYADRYQPGEHVLDIGCGRGEFLELLQARGAQGLGIDADDGMVGAVNARGLRAVQGEAVQYLREHESSFDGVFAAHLIEHLPADAVRCLVQASARALKPGGRLILVTPNPGNLQMQLKDFWIDMQHVRFYSPEIMRWVLHEAGLRDIEVGENPSYRTGPAIGNHPLPPLPLAPTGGGIKRQVKRAINKLLKVNPLRRRLRDAEDRLNVLTGWMQSLYPPAEYFVIGVR